MGDEKGNGKAVGASCSAVNGQYRDGHDRYKIVGGEIFALAWVLANHTTPLVKITH